MKKKTLLILVFLFSNLYIGFTQEKKTYSFDFSELTLQEIFTEIESKTIYQFFYAEEWLATQKITKRFNNKSISTILNELLEKTTINFFIDHRNRVILTQNSIIYNELPEYFFSSSAEEIEVDSTKTIAPVFVKTIENTDVKPIETVNIGKASTSNTKKRFQISGRATTKNNKKPISNLAIFIKGTTIGTTTNINGFYKLNLPKGLNKLETSLPGYESIRKNVIVYNNGTLNFTVAENYEALDEVLVKSEAIKKLEDTNTGNANINARATKNIPLVLGERDVLKVATTLPGVTTAGEGASGFNVRGGKTDQNLILLDDAVIYNPSHFFGIFQALNPFAIKDVNIYKGTIPTEYGGRLSSVFDISTKDASDKKIGLEASIGPITANAVVEIPLKENKSGLMIGARAAYSDWVLRSLKDSNLKNSQASFYDGILKYNLRINDNNNISATGYYSDDKFSITSDSLFSYNNRVASLKWNHIFNEKNSGSIVVNNSQYKFNIDFDGSVNRNFKQRYQIDETELKLKLRYTHSDKHKFSYGVSGKLYTVLPGEINPNSNTDLTTSLSIPKEKGLESAVFIADDFKVTEKLQLNLGLRYSFFFALGPSTQRFYQDGIPRSDNTVVSTESYGSGEIFESYGGPEARISARYLINDELSVKASYNNTYQFIHTLSNNTTVSPIDTWKLSDANIKPQQANQFSLGLYKIVNLNDYEFSLEGFYKSQKNILDFKTGAQLLLNENVETEVLQGEGKAYGVEFLAKKNTGKLTGWLGYTYSRSLFKFDSSFNEERINDGEFFPSNFDKPHDFSLVLNHKFSKRISLSGNFVYQTGRPITFPVGNYSLNGNNFVLYSDRNKFRIPDYYRLDLGINFEGNHKKKKLAHSFWSLSVYNVLGRNNPYSVFFVTQEGEVKALQSSIFNVPVPSITYNFRF